MTKAIPTSDGKARKLITRALGSAALIAMYALGLIGTTGAAMTLSTTPAHAWRGRGYYGRGRGWYGPAVGVGVGAAIVGGAIAASAAAEAQRQEAISYCMSRYRSYNPETGTYIAKGGVERPCP